MGKKIKEAEKFTPPTEKEIMMIQPNNVTFGQYSISEWQENLLTLIGEAIQAHMTKTAELPRDLFNQPYITIPCDAAGGRNNKAKVLKEANKLREKTFSFRWKHPTMLKDIETTGCIITTVHNHIGTNNITININPWAIPFLVYYGVGVGGTRFSKSLVLNIRGNHAKRIYKIICSQRDRREYYYPIEQFRADFKVPDSYGNSQIEQKILEPAKDRIKECGSDIWFDYELICRHPIPKRKPKADTIVFKIKTLHPLEAGGEQYDMYQYVYNWLSRAKDFPSDSTVRDMLDRILSQGGLRRIYDKCCFYDDQVCTGRMVKQHAFNSLLKIVKEDYESRNENEDEKKQKEGKNQEGKAQSAVEPKK